MTVVNATWMLMVGQCRHRSSGACARLGVSRAVAASCGVLFALSPYALYRNLEHMSLVTYLVPRVCTSPCILRPTRRGCMVGAGIDDWHRSCSGSTTSTTRSFGCFVLLVSVLIGWSSRRLAVVRRGSPSACVDQLHGA